MIQCLNIRGNMRKILYIFMISVLIASIARAQEGDAFTPEEKLEIYRQILKRETDPRKIAEVRIKIAESLAAIGNERDATAEYFKVMFNQDAGDLAKLAQEKLSLLYDKPQDGVREEPHEDLSIFFHYNRSIYQNFLDNGDYDKAFRNLKGLINLESGRVDNSVIEVYYEDLGNIYLNGYNEPDTALNVFEKLSNINPEHSKVYVYMGLVHEAKGDLDKAIESYRKSAEVAPYSTWSMYGLSRMEAIQLAKQKKLIKDWYFLGPFDNTDKEALEKDLGPENDIGLHKTFKGINGLDIKWSRPFSYNDSGYVDINNLLDPNDEVAAYALTYAYSGVDRQVEFRVGTSDPIMIWLNDELLLKKGSVSRPVEYDNDKITVNLKKGWNKILIKTAETYWDWGFYFRVTDMQGETPVDIIFDPLQDTDRAKALYSKVRRQKGLRVARTTVILGASIIVFLAGIYLLLSSIHTNIKIRQMKEDFIASVSHELKTPLAAIKMFAETLSMGRVKDKKRVHEYYLTIIRETDRLTRFINKILDFQKIEKGRKIYNFEKVNVINLVKSAVEIHKNQFQDDTVVYEEVYDDNVPEIEIDPDAMSQVFLNLLINAYKYSKDEKYIKVKVAKSDKNIIISIIDRGIGISKDKVTRIFDKFYRVDRDATKDIKGSGIGLAFVKSVIEAHDGEIGVESQINKGSVFKISLPIKKEE